MFSRADGARRRAPARRGEAPVVLLIVRANVIFNNVLSNVDDAKKWGLLWSCLKRPPSAVRRPEKNKRGQVIVCFVRSKKTNQERKHSSSGAIELSHNHTTTGSRTAAQPHGPSVAAVARTQ